MENKMTKKKTKRDTITTTSDGDDDDGMSSEVRGEVTEKKGRGRPMKDSNNTVRTTSDDDDDDGNDGVRDKIRATRNIISHDIPHEDDDSRKINDGGAKKDVNNKMKKNKKKRLRNNDDDVITEGRGLQSPTVSTLTSSPQKKIVPDEAPPTKKPRNSSGYIRYDVIMMSSIIIIPFLQFLSISSDIIRSQHGSEVIHETTPPAPPSPSSITSSNIEPDHHITLGFEKICQVYTVSFPYFVFPFCHTQNLVAQAWDKGNITSSHKPSHPSSRITSGSHGDGSHGSHGMVKKKKKNTL